MNKSESLVLLISLFVLSASAAMPQSKLLPPAAAELRNIERKLDPKLLPNGAMQLKIESKQVFNLVVKNAVQLTVVPVRFRVPVEGSQEETWHDCGVYLISADGTVNFIRTLGEGLPIQCWSIDAVRLQRIYGDHPLGDHPLIILTGNLATGNQAWLQQFVLRWDEEAKTYKLDTVDFK